MSSGSFHSAIRAASVAFPLTAGVFSVAGEAAKLMEPPKPPSVPSQQATDTQTARETQAAAQAQALALQRRRGLASTILTGPLGVTTPTQTQKATLGA